VADQVLFVRNPPCSTGWTRSEDIAAVSVKTSYVSERRLQFYARLPDFTSKVAVIFVMKVAVSM
jgi:hypothetical protein